MQPLRSRPLSAATGSGVFRRARLQLRVACRAVSVQLRDVNLGLTRTIARKGDELLAAREGWMGMGPLGSIDRIRWSFHPTQVSLARDLEIRGQRVPGLRPLAPLVARFAAADGPGIAGGSVDEEDTPIGMASVAKNLRARTVGGDMPGVDAGFVKLGDPSDGPGGPVHPFQRLGPLHVYKIARGTEEGFVDYKLFVGMDVKAFHCGSIAFHTVHSRSRVAGEFDPLGFQRMKLRVYDRSGEGNCPPSRTVGASDGQSILRTLFDCGADPFAIAIE